jgi:riboflavin biosynthesis pyrimidine reductase
MPEPRGPGSPFQLLFTDAAPGEPSLPAAFRRIYPGDWRVPPPVAGRPYVYSNFAVSRDGRITYKIPGLGGGGDVTDFNIHDAWLMGLLRARADAVINGDATAELEPGHVWTAEAAFPDDGPAFAHLRRLEGRSPLPLQVILTLEARLNYEAACFTRPDSHVVLATTARGAANAGNLRCAARVDILNLGQDAADLPRLMQILGRDYGVNTVLCEGGAHVLANMLQARLVDEEFVTLSPLFVGRDPERFRPSYTEGVAWRPETAPYSRPFSLHRAGDFLFLRARCQYRG